MADRILDPNAEARRAPTRVAICIPAQDQCATMFAYDLARLVALTTAQRPDVELRIFVSKGSLIPRQRQELVVSALESGSTHVLFLDSDMRFPKDALLRLLAHKATVVGVNYVTRRWPAKPTCVRRLTPGERPVFVYTTEDSTGLQDVEWCGAGVLLIDCAVFRTMPLPWFSLHFQRETGEWVGEDVWFCRSAREVVGCDILIDHDLSKEVEHLGEWEYRHEHALALRDIVELPPEAATA